MTTHVMMNLTSMKPQLVLLLPPFCQSLLPVSITVVELISIQIVLHFGPLCMMKSNRFENEGSCREGAYFRVGKMTQVSMVNSTLVVGVVVMMTLHQLR